MRNKIASAFLFLAFCILALQSKAQFIHNKLNVYGNVLLEKFHGSAYAKESNFSHPGLIANFQQSIGYNVKILYRTRIHYSFGLQWEQRNASDWELEGRDEYTGSSMQFSSISPTIQFRTKDAKIGKTGLLKAVIELAPRFGISQLTLDKPLFDIQNGTQPIESRDGFIGAAASIGSELEISHNVGITASYSFQYSGTSSALFAEKKFTSSSLSLGFYLKFNKDKRYFYLQ
jgi:hypothetical protein